MALCPLVLLPLGWISQSDPITANQVLSMLRAAQGSIRSYDVYVEIHRSWPLKFVPDKTGTSGRWVRWAKNEQPKSERLYYRQAFARGKYRLEVLKSDFSTIDSVKVFDGEVEQRHVPGHAMGLVGPRQGMYVADGHDYEGYFRTVTAGMRIWETLQERELSLRHEGNRIIILDGAPKPGAPYGSVAISAWLDPQYGMSPVRLDRLRDSRLTRSMVVNKMSEVEAGVWAPVEMEMTFYPTVQRGPAVTSPIHLVKASLDMKRSRWNKQIDDEEFIISFPANTHIADKHSNVGFITGKPGTGDHLDDLIKNAREIYGQPSGPVELRAPGRPYRRWLLLAAVGIAALVILGWLRARKSQP
jgi:hypothetical protein